MKCERAAQDREKTGTRPGAEWDKTGRTLGQDWRTYENIHIQLNVYILNMRSCTSPAAASSSASSQSLWQTSSQSPSYSAKVVAKPGRLIELSSKDCSLP